jgi:hypothetical protein
VVSLVLTAVLCRCRIPRLHSLEFDVVRSTKGPILQVNHAERVCRDLSKGELFRLNSVLRHRGNL